jgi:hypothetical protein
MPDILKNTFDTKTVVALIIFLGGMFAAHLKGTYAIELALEKQSNSFNARIDKLESTITNRDNLQDRDIIDTRKQLEINTTTIEGQNFLINNLQKKVYEK